MSTPTSPVTPSKTSLWVALGVLGGGLLTIALLVAFVIIPGAASVPTYTPPISDLRSQRRARHAERPE